MLILTGISTAVSTYWAIKTTILLQTRYECVSEYVCLCVCVWEYACLKICIICFQLHIQNHFNAEDTIMYFDYMTRNYWFYFQKTRFFNKINSLLKRILLMLTSTGKSFVYVLFKMCKERGRGKKCHMLLVEILTQVFFP